MSVPLFQRALTARLQGGAQGNVDRMKLAKNILLIGLAAQIISFSIFLAIAVVFDRRTSNAPALHRFSDELQRMRKLWIAFYVSAFLIIGRSIYRTAGRFRTLLPTVGCRAHRCYRIRASQLHQYGKQGTRWLLAGA